MPDDVRDQRPDDVVVFDPNEPPPPVSAENPLVGRERVVLENWLENSRDLRRLYRQGGREKFKLEQAAREAVFEYHSLKLQYRSQGMPEQSVEELVGPPMWTPPRVRKPTKPPTPPSGQPTASEPPTSSPSVPFCATAEVSRERPGRRSRRKTGVKAEAQRHTSGEPPTATSKDIPWCGTGRLRGG